MNRLNIFIIYPGNHSIHELLNRIDNESTISAESSTNQAESYLMQCDIALPPEISEKLYLSSLVYPYLKGGKLSEFKHLLSFCNLPTTGKYQEIKSLLEQRGYNFNPLSNNMKLLSEAFEWYRPMDLSKFKGFESMKPRKSGKFTHIEFTVSM